MQIRRFAIKIQADDAEYYAAKNLRAPTTQHKPRKFSLEVEIAGLYLEPPHGAANYGQGAKIMDELSKCVIKVFPLH